MNTRLRTVLTTTAAVALASAVTAAPSLAASSTTGHHHAHHTHHAHRRHTPIAHAAGSDLAFSAVSPFSATVGWTPASGAATVQISVNGHTVDQFAVSSDDQYTLSELWPSTAFSVTVTQLSAGGQQVQSDTDSVTTSAQTSAFPRLYSDSTFINQPIGSNPSLDANSATMVSQAITPYEGSANLVDSATWGIPIVTADAQSASYTIGCQSYWCNLSVTGQHIPTSAQTSTGPDGHLAVLQPNGTELDMWAGQHTSNGWSAGERWTTSQTGSAADCTVVHTCGGADAANFALAAGVVRPQEIAQGHIDHALAITIPDTMQGYIACPATNGDGTHTNSGAIPEGAHVQLNPNINVQALNIPAWQKVIATALQQYGAYVTDTGGSIGIYAQSNQGLPYDAWAKAGVSSNSPSLADLPWNQLHVLSTTQCG
jgi:hypothetical protein